MATTKNRILFYLNNQGWISGSQLEGMAREWETKASVITRRARELVNEGRIERSLTDRRTVQYQLPRPKMTTLQATAYLDRLRIEEEREHQVSLM